MFPVREGKEKWGEKEEESSSKTHMGTRQRRESLSLPSRHCREREVKERKQKKLDTEGGYTKIGRKRKWENSALQASEGKEKAVN